MKSVPQAMTWELLWNGRWGLLAALLGANALPAMILSALRHEGPLDAAEESTLVIHVVVTLMNAVCFGAAIMTAQGHPSRIYTFPVSTATLVTGQMLPAMVAIFAESFLSTMILNTIFQLDWPVWGPSLFMACALGAVQAVLWLTEKSAWLMPGLAVVGGGLGMWYMSRYGLVLTRPHHVWSVVTPAEHLTMLAVALSSYLVAIVGVGRDRCGEALRTEALRVWFERVFDPAPAHGLPFRTPRAAQFWFEWRQKGAMPWMMVFLLVVGLCGWVLFNRDPAFLLEGCWTAGYFLPVIGFVMGLVVGTTGAADGKFEMGQFLATRPMTDSDFSRIILKATALNVIAAWLVWCAAALVVTFVLWLSHLLPGRLLPLEMQWWHVAAVLPGTWLTTAVVASILLCGRQGLLAALLFGIPGLFILGLIFEKWGLAEDQRARFHEAMLIMYATVFVTVTVWTFVAAWRHKLIGTQTVSVATGLWAFATVLLVFDLNLHDGRTIPVQILVIGFAALALAPLAVAPLAVAWNRHR